MDETYNFATTILTSKTPQQAAQIIPNTIQGSTGVNKDLIAWFNNYEAILSQYNSQLKSLVQDADKISQRSSSGFNGFPRNWNCLLNAIKLEENNNEIFIKNMRMEILNPLKHLIDKDVRISELVVNGQELQEIAQNLDEYKWNYKAPQGFQNLEDFKKIEIQTLFDVILNFVQLQNSKLTKELKNNENSTNYLLGSFKLDNEMKSQLKYLLKTEFEIPQRNIVAPPKASSKSSMTKTPTAEKRQSKIKSKVGSIFGRKKKDKKYSNDAGIIPEDASVSTSELTRNTTRRSSHFAQPSQPPHSYEFKEPVPASQPDQHYQKPTQQAPETYIKEQFENRQEPPQEEHYRSQEQFNEPVQGNQEPLQPRRESFQPKDSTQESFEHIQEPKQFTSEPSQKDTFQTPFVQASQEQASTQQTPFKSSSENGFQTVSPDSPNVIRYENDSDTDNEQSLLQKLDHEKLAPVSIPENRYSFEQGDDEISTPKTTQDSFQPEKKSMAPAPPPSRKVTHNDRDSFINQRSSSFIQPLQSQDTGNMLKNEFKHSTLNESGLNTSIAEIVNANFKDGQLVKSSVVGEVAFNYVGEIQNRPLIISIPYQYDKLIVNKTFMEEVGDNLYRLFPEQIFSKTLGGLKYLTKDAIPPITIQQIWKYEPHQSSLMISIRSEHPLILENFIVSVALSNCQATSASSKPGGAFNHKTNRITWKYDEPLHLQGEEKLIARFMTQGQGIESEHGVQVKFEIKDPTIKYCTIYENNVEVPTLRNLISGNYSGHF